ncbi:MAG: biopolymer transporter ExbD [Alphaproteobacteria bacterium]|nr:biopolymer transporter ExbD [Alphaproteobacteria bacterium]
MRLSDWQRKRSTIGLTPLIDVVFLLLIFFMLASTFLKFSAVRISGAQGGGKSGNLSEIALIQVRGSDEIRVNGTLLSMNGFLSHINQLTANGITRAVLQPAKTATVQDLVKVLEVTKSSTLKSVVVVK